MLSFRSVKTPSLTHWMLRHRNYFSLSHFQLDETTLRVLIQYIEGFSEMLRWRTGYQTHFNPGYIWNVSTNARISKMWFIVTHLFFISVICRMRWMCKRQLWRWNRLGLNPVRVRSILWGSSFQTCHSPVQNKIKPYIWILLNAIGSNSIIIFFYLSLNVKACLLFPHVHLIKCLAQKTFCISETWMGTCLWSVRRRSWNHGNS